MGEKIMKMIAQTLSALIIFLIAESSFGFQFTGVINQFSDSLNVVNGDNLIGMSINGELRYDFGAPSIPDHQYGADYIGPISFGNFLLDTPLDRACIISTDTSLQSWMIPFNPISLYKMGEPIFVTQGGSIVYSGDAIVRVSTIENGSFYFNVWKYDSAYPNITASVFNISGSIDKVTGATPVPAPAAIWLFGSGIAGLIGLKIKFQR